jgi:hypothetical protein
MDPIQPITYVASATVSTTVPIIATVGFDVFAVIGSMFGGGDFSSFSGGLLSFLSSFWSWFAVLSYIVSLLMIVLYVYASIRRNLYVGLMAQALRDAEEIWEERESGGTKGGKLNDVLKHSSSENPNDWKLAIIEADVILDQLLKERGYVGTSLGERLKSISPEQLSTINDAWEAHKVRNKIAHEGSDFVLTQRSVQETITKYQRVFAEFGVS